MTRQHQEKVQQLTSDWMTSGPLYIVVSTGQQLPMFFQVINYGDPFSWTAPATLFVEEIQWWKDSMLLYTQPIRRYYHEGDRLEISSVSLYMS